jgi:hypothetical protein
VVSSIFAGLGQYFRDRRIVKAAVSKNVDNEALFEVIRSMTRHNQLNQRQVDEINSVLDADRQDD